MAMTVVDTSSKEKPAYGRFLEAISGSQLRSLLWRILGLTSGFLANVWIARQIGPDRLGYSTYVLALASHAGFLISLNQETRYVREYRKAVSGFLRASVIAEVLGLRVVLSILALGIWWLGFDFLYHGPASTNLLLGGVLVLAGQGNSALWLLQAQGRTDTQVFLYFMQNALLGLLCLLLIDGATPLGLDLLIYGTLTFSIALTSWWVAIHGEAEWGDRRVWLRLFYRAWTGVRTGGWLVITGMFMLCYTQVEQYFLAGYVGIGELGIYRIAMQVGNAAGLVAGLFNIILYPKLIDAHSSGNLWAVQVKTAKLAIGISTLASLLSWGAIWGFFSSIFGQQYEQAALPAAILVTSKLITIVNGVYAWGLWAAGKDRLMAGVLAFVACVSLLLNFLLVSRFGMMAASGVNLLSEALILIICVILSGFYFGKWFKNDRLAQ